jgi:hypothetical protein
MAGGTPASAVIGRRRLPWLTKATRQSACLDPSGQFDDRFPQWVGSAITDRLEVTRDHLGQRTGSRAQGHRQARGPNQTQPTSRQLRMRLGVWDRQHRAGHARDPNPLGGGPRSYPAARGTADQARLEELPALTLASPGGRWMARHSGAGRPRPGGVAAKTRHRGRMAPWGSSRGHCRTGNLARAWDGAVAPLIRRDWRFDGIWTEGGSAAAVGTNLLGGREVRSLRRWAGFILGVGGSRTGLAGRHSGPPELIPPRLRGSRLAGGPECTLLGPGADRGPGDFLRARENRGGRTTCDAGREGLSSCDVK